MSDITIQFVNNPAPITVQLVAAGSGQPPIDLDLVVWVETTGNDATGQVSNPAFPFQTMQAAYDAGGKGFRVGRGTFAGITLAAPESLSFEGYGFNQTLITLIQSDFDLTLQDVGFLSLQINTIDLSGDDGGLDQAGGNGADLILVNTYCVNIDISGGVGGVGTTTGAMGGRAGSLTGENVLITAVLNARSGNGGDGGAPDGDGGIGGNGNTVLVRYSTVGSILVGAGLGGAPSGSGATGPEGAPGSFTGVYSEMASVAMSTSGDVYNGTFMQAASITAGSQGTINASKINGTFIG